MRLKYKAGRKSVCHFFERRELNADQSDYKLVDLNVFLFCMSGLSEVRKFSNF